MYGLVVRPPLFVAQSIRWMLRAKMGWSVSKVRLETEVRFGSTAVATPTCAMAALFLISCYFENRSIGTNAVCYWTGFCLSKKSHLI